MTAVYGLRRPGGPIRYIGQTKYSVAERLRRHYTAARCGSSYPVHRWMRKHSDIEGVVIIGDAVWDQDEKLVIQAAAKFGMKLLNCTSGGRGMQGLSAESRAKIGDAHRGKPKSEEHRRKIGDAHRGKLKDNGHRGMKRSQETRKRLSGSNNPAAKVNRATVDKILELRSQNVRHVDVARVTGLSYGLVYAVATGRSWSHQHG